MEIKRTQGVKSGGLSSGPRGAGATRCGPKKAPSVPELLGVREGVTEANIKGG